MNKDRFEFGKNWRSFSPLIDDEAPGIRPGQNVRKRSGLFGSGNDEYLFRKRDANSIASSQDRPRPV